MPIREDGLLPVSAKLMVLQLIVVAGICAFLFFFNLGAFGLLGADEPRYAQIGREMFARHDWIVPTLNGSPWLEKPVLLYWMEMIAYRTYGVQDWVARLPSGVFAAGMVLAIFFFMRRFRPGAELDAALIAASMVGVLAFARGASTDMAISAPLCVAMLAWWAWNETEKKLWLAAFYALLALGALAKGPVAPAFAVLIVGAYAVLRRDGKIFVRTLWWPGFALFLSIALPWYVAVQNKVPQFFHVFFIEHNLERFGSDLYRHSQPFWYYIPVFVLAVMPWTVFALPAVVSGVRDWIKKLRAAGEDVGPQPEEDRMASFLLLWVLIPIVFFSISRSKLPGYILPSIPPAALLAAVYLHRLQKIPRIMQMLHSLVCGAVMAAALLAPWILIVRPPAHCGFLCTLRLLNQNIPQATVNIVAFSAGLIAVTVLLLVRWRGLQVLHFATLLPLVLGMTFVLHPAVSPLLDQKLSARPVDARLRSLGVAGEPLVVLEVKRDVEYGLNFYRNQRPLHYDKDGIPAEPHVVVTKQGNGDAVRALVGDRQVTSLGVFAPQQLEFFAIATSK